MKENHHSSYENVNLQSDDLIIGLGSADRNLLATLIALFEDSKISKRLKEKSVQSIDHLKNALEKFSGISITVGEESKNDETGELMKGLQSRMQYWLNREKFTDDDLRLVLWIYLRNALRLSPSLSGSVRSLKMNATEIVAATIHIADPPKTLEKVKSTISRSKNNTGTPKITLNDIAVPVIQEMSDAALKNIQKLDEHEKSKVLDKIRHSLTDLDEVDQKKILESVGANDFNDSAIKKVMMTGGGLAIFGNAVSMAGFSAYILAAQISAFVPLVSGPGLVSFVAVMSNPITMIGGTIAAGVWAKNKADSNIQSVLAIRVVSMLAVLGMSNRDRGGSCVRTTLNSFKSIETLTVFGELPASVVDEYKRKWSALNWKARSKEPESDSTISDLMEQPIEKLHGFMDSGSTHNQEIKKTVWVTGLTIGDIIYSISVINPKVIQAADFSRSADLSDRLSFAEFSKYLMNMDAAGYEGGFNHLKGYVAEQLVATQLILQGHDVEFPEDSNEAGWDIMVDGEKFQIKNLLDTGGLKAHFDKYEYPVIANSELSDSLTKDLEERVFFVDGFSDATVVEITEYSLKHGESVFEPDVPIFAIGVSTAFALRDYSNGRIRSDQAIEQVILDGGTRAGLATIGGFIGSGIGLIVYGPAGALIWGALTPILAQSQTTRVKNRIKRTIKTNEMIAWETELTPIISNLINKADKILDKKLEKLRKRYREYGDGVLSQIVKQKLTDDGRYLLEVKDELKRIGNQNMSMEDKTIELLRFLPRSTVHPVKYQNELIKIQKILSEKPTLSQSSKRWFNEKSS